MAELGDTLGLVAVHNRERRRVGRGVLGAQWGNHRPEGNPLVEALSVDHVGNHSAVEVGNHLITV